MSSDVTKCHVFDSVLVCTGHHAQVNFPTFPGMDTFKGKVLHSHDYKDYHGFDDKRVVVVGARNSGGDIAVEIATISSQVFLSTRRGTWIFNRIAENGDPFDMVYNTRFNIAYVSTFRNYLGNAMKRRLNYRLDHKKFCLQPENSPFAQQLTFSNDLPNKIISGRVVVKSNIREFTETGVIFDDETEEKDIYCVVLATGYVVGFPFLDRSVLEVQANKVNMFKNMFPPDLSKHTLAVIGCFQPAGALMPICENQCRLATRVFQNLATLPSRSDMWADIRAKQDALLKRYVTSLRHTIQVDYISFMDELAELYGAKPNIGKLFLIDPRLALTCWFGPATPYQYRLMGPGSWSGARKAIMTQWDRTYHPLKTRACNVPGDSYIWTKLILGFIILAVFLFYVFV